MEDYHYTESISKKNNIFNAFMMAVWKCNNPRTLHKKEYKYNVLEKHRNSDIGKIFDKYSTVPYVYYRSTTSNQNYLYLIRQKINNLYSYYCDKNVCIRREYFQLLQTPKRLYYSWINQKGNIKLSELEIQIKQAFAEAENLKRFYEKQKLFISWSEYKKLVYGFIKNCFNNYQPFDNITSFTLDVDIVTEDHYCVNYICKCLSGEMQKYQKKYYGVKEHSCYGRCISCGRLYEKKSKDTKSTRCQECYKTYRKTYKRQKQKSNRAT